MTTSDPIPAITVHELWQKKIAGEPFFLLDVRTEAEFIAGRLAFADVLIPHDILPGNLHKLPSDKGMPIFNFCRSGRRSAGTTQFLRSIGYAQAYNVTGGILEWIRSGYNIETGGQS